MQSLCKLCTFVWVSGFPTAQKSTNPFRAESFGSIAHRKKAARIRQNSTNLCRRQTKNSSEMFALGRRQVALLTKPSLQFVRLRLGEQHAAFLLVRRNADCWSSAASRRCMRPHIERIRSVGVLGCRAARLCASVDVVVGRLAALWLDGCGVQCGGQLVVSYRLLRWIAAEITD